MLQSPIVFPTDTRAINHVLMHCAEYPKPHSSRRELEKALGPGEPLVRKLQALYFCSPCEREPHFPGSVESQCTPSDRRHRDSRVTHPAEYPDTTSGTHGVSGRHNHGTAFSHNVRRFYHRTRPFRELGTRIVVLYQAFVLIVTALLHPVNH